MNYVAEVLQTVYKTHLVDKDYSNERVELPFLDKQEIKIAKNLTQPPDKKLPK